MYPDNNKTNVVINYDKKNDILYVSLGHLGRHIPLRKSMMYLL